MQFWLGENNWAANQIDHDKHSLNLWPYNASQQTNLNMSPGINPINILQCKIYATLFFKHFDWLKNVSSQSKCLKKLA